MRQRGDEAAARLDFDREQGQKPIAIDQGQDIYTDPQTGAIVARKLPSRVFDPNAKRFIEDPAAGAGAVPSSIPLGAIKKLRENPTMAADFDAKYGAGAAARVMGQ